jgi:hypothetical protein
LHQLTSEELRAWIIIDPVGIARRFQQEHEMKRLEWKKSAR